MGQDDDDGKTTKHLFIYFPQISIKDRSDLLYA